MSFPAGILTISDMGARGEREDTSGAAIREILDTLNVNVLEYRVVPDEADLIAATLTEWADVKNLALIVTTGGTGLGPRDVTPEATLRVIQRHVPGLAEAMRAESLKYTPHAMLSRGLAGVRGRTLIVNLPGSPKGVRECLGIVLPVLPHALDLLHGGGADHRAKGAES